MQKVFAALMLAALAAGCCSTESQPTVYTHPDPRTYAELTGQNPQKAVAVKNDILTVKNRHGEIKISLIGANVFSYVPTGGQEVLFSVKNPDFTTNAFLHAGIPICWPWFNMNGEAGSTMHSFVRQMRWKVVENVAGQNVSRLVLSLESNRETLRMWPYEFKLLYTIELGESLSVSLRTTNTGDIPFFITEGFHTYLEVSDVNSVALRGLDGVRNDRIYSGAANPIFKGDLKFYAGEGRVFFPGKGEYVLFDEGKNRAIALAARGHRKLILWSIPPSSSTGQFAENDWKRFVCLEPSTISREAQIKVLPGREHELRMNIKAVPLK